MFNCTKIFSSHEEHLNFPENEKLKFLNEVMISLAYLSTSAQNFVHINLEIQTMSKIDYAETNELSEKNKCFENNMLEERKNHTINLRMIMEAKGIFLLWLR